MSRLGAQEDRSRTGPVRMTDVPGGAPAVPPGDLDIWTARSSGPGARVLEWQPENGNWSVVVMRADGGAGVDVVARVGVTAPGLAWLSGGLLAAGAVLALIGALLVALAVRRAQQGPSTPAVPPPGPPPGPVPPGAGGPVLTSGHPR
jgi:hypothetical protein